jgi:hypothetical protein
LRESIAAAAIALAAVGCDGDFRFDSRQSVDASMPPPDEAGAGADTGDDDRRDGAPPSGTCLTDKDCLLPSLHCDIGTGACVACTLDDHCTSPSTPDCDTYLHRCVECGASRTCAQGQVCDSRSRACLTACHGTFECAAPAIVCDPIRGVCLGCILDEECRGSASGPICNVASGRCVQCARDSDCAAPAARCEWTSGKCVQCLGSSDCSGATPLCDPSGWKCVAKP